MDQGPATPVGMNVQSADRSPVVTVLLWAIIVIACVARFAHLDADPKLADWVGYITDEARWVETARNLALFGDPALYELSKLHLVLSPGFQAVVYLVFKLGGTGFMSARIWSAFCGTAIVVVALFSLRQRISGLPLVFIIGVLAFEPMILGLSRVAIPEMPSVLFTLLAFATMFGVGRSSSPYLAAGGGVLMAIAISMKGTTAFVVPVFASMLLVADFVIPMRQRLIRFAAFSLGVAVPAALGVAAAVAADVLQIRALPEVSTQLLRFIEPAHPYTILSRFVANPALRNVNMLLLGAWLGSWVLMFRHEFGRTVTGRLYFLTGVWSVGWLAIWSLLAYAPNRYFVHVIIPLTIHVGAGFALWGMIGAASMVARLEDLRARGGSLLVGWLVLPTAVILALWTIGLVRLAGIEVERMSHRLMLFAGIAAILVVGVRGGWLPRLQTVGLLSFPLTAAVLQLVVAQTIDTYTLEPAAIVALQVLAIVAVGIAGWVFLVARRTKATWFGRPRAQAALCAGLLVGLLIENAAMLVEPTYSIRDASRSLRGNLANVGLVRSFNAGSLMLETDVRYSDQLAPDVIPDAIVSFDRRVRVDADFERIDRYQLDIHQRYDASVNRAIIVEGQAFVDFYRRSGSAGDRGQRMPAHD